MKNVIFDIDGTLTDTTEVDNHCFTSAFYSTFGRDISQYNWESIKHVTDWGITEEVFMLEFGRLPSTTELMELKTSFINHLMEEKERDINSFQEIKGAKSFFNHLKGHRDYQVGIATGGWEHSARFKLNALGIEFTQIPFSNSDHFRSRESIINHVIKQMNVMNRLDGSKVIYFGDGVWDYHACKQMGVEFIGIDSKGDGRLSSIGVQHVFRNFSDVNNIIKTINEYWGIGYFT